MVVRGAEHVDVITSDFAIAARQADFVSPHMTAGLENVHFINRERLTISASAPG